MTRSFVCALAALAGTMASAQELNHWDERGAAPLQGYGEPKTRAEVRAELADARAAGWRLNSGEVSWFAEPGVVTRLAHKAHERVARRVQSQGLAAAHKQQFERVVPVGLRQRRPDFVLPAAIAAPVQTAVVVPVLPASAAPIRGDAQSVPVFPLLPEPGQGRTELPPLMLREDRLDFRAGETIPAEPAHRALLPATEPPEAPASADSMSVWPSADQG